MNNLLIKRTTLVFIFIIHLFSSLAQNQKVDSLLRKLKHAKRDTNKVNLLYSISKGFLYSEPDKAIEYSKKAIELADALNYYKGKAAALDIYGIFYQNKGEYDKAREYYQQSLNEREKLGNQRLIAHSYNNFGVLNRRKGDFPESKKCFLKALAISNQQKDSLLLSKLYNNLGLVSENLGQYEKSVNYHLQSLKLREKVGNEGEIAASLNNIGLVFITLNKHEEALTYLTKSMRLKEKLSNKRSLASTYLNIGVVKFYQDKFDESLDYYNKSLEIYELLGDKKSIGAVLDNSAYIAKTKGDLNLALSYNQKCIETMKAIGSQDQLCKAFNSISLTQIELKDYAGANKSAIEAKKIAFAGQMLPELKVSLKRLYTVQSLLGNYRKANNYLLQFIDVKDSLLNEANNKQIVELQTKYETEKKEQKIESLSKEKEIEVLKNRQSRHYIITLLISILLIIVISVVLFRNNKLKAMQKQSELVQKLLRSQMNPHFIFNAISSIQGFVLKNKPEEASSYLSNFARLMRHILLNSREEFITLKDEIDTLDNYLKLQQLRMDHAFEYEINLYEEIDDEELAIPPMIVQPFVENSVKHGMSRRKDKDGHIAIDFYTKNEKLVIEVRDNGVGLAKANQLKEKGHTSLATEITRERLRLLGKSFRKNAEIKIEDQSTDGKTNTGTKVVIELPVRYC